MATKTRTAERKNTGGASPSGLFPKSKRPGVTTRTGPRLGIPAAQSAATTPSQEPPRIATDTTLVFSLDALYCKAAYKTD